MRGAFALLVALGLAAAPAARGEDTPEANPLPKILDLMKEVEARLNDADPDEVTQADQKKLVEAMKFEDKTRAALDDLIRQIEEGT